KLPASPDCCCGLLLNLRLRRRKADGSCARRIRRRMRHGASGVRRVSTQSLSATVTARPGDGSWNGNVMSAFSARRRILSLWLPAAVARGGAPRATEGGGCPGGWGAKIYTKGGGPPPPGGGGGGGGGPQL